MPSLNDPCPHPHNLDGHHDVRFQGGREVCEDCGATHDGTGAPQDSHMSLVDQARADLRAAVAEAARQGHCDLALACEVALLALSGQAAPGTLTRVREVLKPVSGRPRKVAP